MNMRNYMKREKLVPEDFSTDELVAKFAKSKFSKKHFICGLLILLLLPAFCLTKAIKHWGSIDGEDGIISLVGTDVAAASTKKDVISIPSGITKANPFLPYRNIGDNALSDVPTFDLVEPPEVIDENSDAARLLDTIVSGILYDKFSPSAILNIEGNDYLVKKGDVVNNYKIVDILKDSVTVKLGSNTYKAGIGEILTEGTVNHNDVSNLSKKFGGEKR